MEDFFTSKKHIYFVGIKGAGMTALAELLIARGVLITGSDTSEHFYTDEILKRLQVFYTEEFKEENISNDIDLVIYSTAYRPDNHPELLFAQKSGIQLLSYPEAVGKLTEEKFTLAVCGTHGKTTTSSLLAETLRAIGEDPSAIIGSQIRQWGGSALSGSGRFLVLEADEYQNKLAFYKPFGVILTSVDYDHPDFFPTFNDYLQVFKDFVARIPKHGVLVYNGDDSNACKVAESAVAQKISYGFLPHNDIQIGNFVPKPLNALNTEGIVQSFELFAESKSLGQFELKLAGRHNTMNAAGVVALLKHLVLPLRKAGKKMTEFLGTARRFEFLGERFGALIYDDYAHHPEEIMTTLKAFKELYPEKNLTVIFHPHTYTRTKALLHEFAQSFDDANEVIVLPIYGSAREEQGGVSSEELVKLINHYSSDKNKAKVESNYQAIEKNIEKSMGKETLVVSLGAGDVWQITHALAKKKM
jgi:UDP-N-acetylmuramate--alanine ligase